MVKGQLIDTFVPEEFIISPKKQKKHKTTTKPLNGEKDKMTIIKHKMKTKTIAKMHKTTIPDRITRKRNKQPKRIALEPKNTQNNHEIKNEVQLTDSK